MASTFEKLTANDDGGLAMWETSGDNLSKIAMTFTIGTVGTNLTFNVSSVDVKGKRTGTLPNAVTVQITEVKPDGSPDTNNILSTGEIAIADFITTDTWINIVMTSTTALKASTQYALVFSGLATSDANFITLRTDNGGSYAGGFAWAITGAGAWASKTPIDILFQINGGDYAGTLCTLADARNKAGVNASANSTNESLVSDYVRQAEGTICAVTRFDWVDAYSALSDDVKFILNDVASNLAAIYAITYDMSGFTDRVEAETMINVYRDAALRGLSLLRDKKTKAFIVGDT